MRRLWMLFAAKAITIYAQYAVIKMGYLRKTVNRAVI